MGGPLLNMNLGGDFNQMQMMMSMQNGMMPNNFTNFSMMGMCAPRLWREEGRPQASRSNELTVVQGMPGAGLGPMMQNMYMNGSFESQGMGMNMNMMGGGVWRRCWLRIQ